MPNFFVIGAPRSGTTSLHHYLGQHPQVFMCPVKEPRFFVFQDGDSLLDPEGRSHLRRDAVTDLAAYQKLFQAVREEIAVGEASPIYLATPGCAAKIARMVPEAKLIAILRNPADRAFSDWAKGVKDGEESRSFEEALADEEKSDATDRLRRYRRGGLYSRHLDPYMEIFGKSRIRVLLYEDLSNAVSVIPSVYPFLGVDAGFVGDFSIRHNASGRPRHIGFQRMLTRQFPLKNLLKQILPERWGHRAVEWSSSRNLRPLSMNPLTRERLIEEFREDIGRLERQIDRDLSHWLTGTTPGQP